MYNMVEPQKNAEWNKLNTKDHKLWDSVYMPCPKKAKRKSRSVVAQG